MISDRLNHIEIREYAKFGTRLACLVGDLIFIQLITIPLYILLGFLWVPMPYDLLTLIIWLIYSTIMNASAARGTHAKMYMRVHVEKENGERLSLWESAIRSLLGIFLFGLIIGFIPFLFTKKKKGIPDIIVGSVVRHRKS